MTVAWDAVEAAALTWATSVLSTDLGGADQIVWRDKAKGVIRAPYLELSIENETPVGQPDVTYDEVVVGGRTMLGPHVTGLMSFTLEARIRSRDQSALRSARWYLEKLRSSLYHPVMLEPFVAAGVAFERSHERLQIIKFDYEGRVESVAILEAFFAVLSDLTFAPASASTTLDYVESAEIALNGEPPLVVP
jgi:hypothetical protein